MSAYAWNYIGCIVAVDMIVKWDFGDVSNKASWSDIIEEWAEILEHPECRPYLWDCSGGKAAIVEVKRNKAEKIVAASLVDACEDLMISLYRLSQAGHLELPVWIMEHEGDRLYALHEGIPLEEYL